MSKSAAVLLMVVGLAIGLWLGFNPKAHQETVQDWHRVTTAVAHLGSNVSIKTRASQPTAPVAKPAASPQFSPASAWKQISTAFESLLSSMQRLWVTVTARIGRTR